MVVMSMDGKNRASYVSILSRIQPVMRDGSHLVPWCCWSFRRNARLGLVTLAGGVEGPAQIQTAQKYTHTQN